MDGTGLARAVHRCRVEWMDTDAAGHHHNTAVVRYVEAAEAALMRAYGVTGYFGAAPRVRYEADFSAPLWFGQEVTTVLAVERIGTSSVTFRFEVWGDGQLAASGRYVAVHVPAGLRASAPWPEAWVSAWTSGGGRDSGGGDSGGGDDVQPGEVPA
ncbi:acyl-CoA thioesterase [Kitasatospora aureofaciens]|uniref:acyl-CoA thioesterase n=1 Tax=Kitasatospora aureofaciens TaxID=1894 RepID=UPI0027E19F96|nr:thioesterase family protein [Kitasatospora aureofaciens]